MKKKNSPSDTRILIFALLWAASYIGCLLIVKEMEPSKTTGILLSFLPAVTFVIFMYHFIKGIGLMDELEIRIQLEATVWGFSLGLLLLMTLGLLDYVVTLKKEDWGYTHLIPFLFVFYFIGIIISRKKYTGNEKQS